MVASTGGTSWSDDVLDKDLLRGPGGEAGEGRSIAPVEAGELMWKRLESLKQVHSPGCFACSMNVSLSPPNKDGVCA